MTTVKPMKEDTEDVPNHNHYPSYADEAPVRSGPGDQRKGRDHGLGSPSPTGRSKGIEEKLGPTLTPTKTLPISRG